MFRGGQIGAHCRTGALIVGLALTAACDLLIVQPVPVPPARPAGLAAPVGPAPVSAASKGLQTYYARVQNDLMTQGLLRTDGGGPDTPFRADDLVRNFEQIAFFDEYTRGAGLRGASGAQSGLRRWSGPVRISVEFGRSVPQSVQQADTARVRSYAARLSRATGHPISTAGTPNFLVLVLSEDDRAAALPRIKRFVPNISDSSLEIFRDIPRSIHCLVAAFSTDSNSYNYTRAIAIVRAEHPDLLRQSCLHEEIAQGLGLANDSPAARPSIFNDDDEFALLTSHDELLLSMLYDPRLSQGMSADQARPIARIIARELTGTPL